MDEGTWNWDWNSLERDSLLVFLYLNIKHVDSCTENSEQLVFTEHRLRVGAID